MIKNFVFIPLMIMLLSACNPAEAPKSAGDYYIENSSLNMYSVPLVQIGNTIYFPDADEKGTPILKGRIAAEEFTVCELPGSASNLNVKDKNTLLFLDDTNHQICTVDLTTKEIRQICDVEEDCSKVLLKDGFVYYLTNLHDTYDMFRIDLLSGERIKMSEEVWGTYDISDEYLWYYTVEPEGGKIKKQNLKDLSQATETIYVFSKTSAMATYLSVIDDEVFFLGGSTLYAVNSDGQRRTVAENVVFYNYAGGYIYYVNHADCNTLYRVKTNGSNHEKIFDKNASFITVLYDSLCCINLESLYQIDLETLDVITCVNCRNFTLN